MPHPNINLESKLKWLSQFNTFVPDLNRDGKTDKNDQNIACGFTCKKILADAGFTSDTISRVDMSIWDVNKKLVKAPTYQISIDTVHQNFNAECPTIVGVNRGIVSVGNHNAATLHYVLMVSRYFNEISGKYEYHFWDVGTNWQDKGTHASQIFTLGSDGLWHGKSNYCGLDYVVTEVRRTTKS